MRPRFMELMVPVHLSLSLSLSLPPYGRRLFGLDRAQLDARNTGARRAYRAYIEHIGQPIQSFRPSRPSRYLNAPLKKNQIQSIALKTFSSHFFFYTILFPNELYRDKTISHISVFFHTPFPPLPFLSTRVSPSLNH
jgi:hypothetical protein